MSDNKISFQKKQNSKNHSKSEHPLPKVPQNSGAYNEQQALNTACSGANLGTSTIDSGGSLTNLSAN